MSTPTIVGDAAFLAFQSKLATVVTNARARGVFIGRDCCPLGAHPDALAPSPPSTKAREGGWAEVDRERLVEFINGWAGCAGSDPGFSGPYAELGAEYRRRTRP